MQITEVKSPSPYNTDGKISVFLAGAIDMGAAVDWQSQVVQNFKSWNKQKEIVFLNPRRTDWDSSWQQVPEDRQFRQQVEWELTALQKADIVFLNLPKDSKAPISMLELGLMAGANKNLIVCCDPQFYRYGNIALTAERYGFTMYTDFDTAVTALRMRCVMESSINSL